MATFYGFTLQFTGKIYKNQLRLASEIIGACYYWSLKYGVKPSGRKASEVRLSLGLTFSHFLTTCAATVAVIPANITFPVTVKLLHYPS